MAIVALLGLEADLVEVACITLLKIRGDAFLEAMVEFLALVLSLLFTGREETDVLGDSTESGAKLFGEVTRFPGLLILTDLGRVF